MKIILFFSLFLALSISIVASAADLVAQINHCNDRQGKNGISTGDSPLIAEQSYIVLVDARSLLTMIVSCVRNLNTSMTKAGKACAGIPYVIANNLPAFNQVNGA